MWRVSSSLQFMKVRVYFSKEPDTVEITLKTQEISKQALDIGRGNLVYTLHTINSVYVTSITQINLIIPINF